MNHIVVEVGVFVFVKGRVAAQQDEKNRPERINVALEGVKFARKDLGRKVVGRADDGGHGLIGRLENTRDSEIRNFYQRGLALVFEEQVFRLFMEPSGRGG